MVMLNNIARWASGAITLFASAWTGFLAYLGEGFSSKWEEKVETVPSFMSASTEFVSNYWWLFGVFSVALLFLAICLAWKVNAPVLFYCVVGIVVTLAAFFINLMVVSAGLELLLPSNG